MTRESKDYMVKWKQLEKLKDELEKVEEFYKFITDSDDGSLCWVLNAEEGDLLLAHERFSEALRELKYLVEDISNQELSVNCCGE